MRCVEWLGRRHVQSSRRRAPFYRWGAGMHLRVASSMALSRTPRVGRGRASWISNRPVGWPVSHSAGASLSTLTKVPFSVRAIGPLVRIIQFGCSSFFAIPSLMQAHQRVAHEVEPSRSPFPGGARKATGLQQRPWPPKLPRHSPTLGTPAHGRPRRTRIQ